jgi:hypothetical protein
LLFVASFVLAVLLFFWLVSTTLRNWFAEVIAAIAHDRIQGSLFFLFGITAALAALWTRRQVRNAPGKPSSVILTVGLALVAAAGLTLSLHLVGTFTGNILSNHNGATSASAQIYSRYLVIVSIALLPAIAGAMRFRAEKLAYEAEALSYREALRWFEHADELLTRHPPGSGNEAADARGRDIVDRLGRLALAENEAWLKARRQRPLSPVIGG